MLFLLGHNLKIVNLGEGGWKELTFGGGGSLLGWGIFLGWGMRKFLASGRDSSPILPVRKRLIFDYLSKTSIINLKEFTLNSINCIVWESNLSIRTQK